MESSKKKAIIRADRRKQRVRAKTRGTGAMPRLCVVKTNRHIQAQLIDDDTHHTLVSYSTLSKEMKGSEFAKKSKEAGQKIGEMIAEKALGMGISQVVFDRGPFTYHGCLKALADGARAKGLKL